MTWFNQSYRHSLAARGVRTSFKAKTNEIRTNFAVVERDIWGPPSVARTGKDMFDEGQKGIDYKSVSYKAGPPAEVLEILEKEGVDIYVPNEDIKYYVGQYDLVDRARIPFIVKENGQIVDQGNLAWVYAALEIGLSEIPLAVYEI